MTDYKLMKLLKDKKVVDAYQYFEACAYKLYLAELSYSAPEKVIEATMHDKKAEGGNIVTVRLDDIGRFRFEAASQERLMKDYLEVFG